MYPRGKRKDPWVKMLKVKLWLWNLLASSLWLHCFSLIKSMSYFRGSLPISAVLWIQGHNGPLTNVSYCETLLSSYYVLAVQDEPLGLFIIKPSIVI